ETLLMEGVKKGGDRQALHELVREQSFAVKRAMHETGAGNDLIERLGAAEAMPFTTAEIRALCDPRAFTGRAEAQVLRYLESEVDPWLAAAERAFDEDPPDIAV